MVHTRGDFSFPFVQAVAVEHHAASNSERLGKLAFLAVLAFAFLILIF